MSSSLSSMRCGHEGLRAPSPQLLSFEEETDVRGGGLVAKWCLTLVTPQTSSPGFSVHGILQARILEWVTISFSRGSSQPRDQTRISWIACGLFTN